MMVQCRKSCQRIWPKFSQNAYLSNTKGFPKTNFLIYFGYWVPLFRAGVYLSIMFRNSLHSSLMRSQSQKTSLLRTLQAQTLPDVTPPIGKIHPFCKMAVTFETLMGF